MHSCARGAAALIVLRSLSSAPRLSLLKAARYSSMFVAFTFSLPAIAGLLGNHPTRYVDTIDSTVTISSDERHGDRQRFAMLAENVLGSCLLLGSRFPQTHHPTLGIGEQ